jgi:hypothetical protein
MQLSLSGRLIEMQYRYCEMSVPNFMRFAQECDHDAVELRATQITAETTPEQVVGFREIADELGISVSCIAPPGIAGSSVRGDMDVGSFARKMAEKLRELL